MNELPPPQPPDIPPLVFLNETPELEPPSYHLRKMKKLGELSPEMQALCIRTIIASGLLLFGVFAYTTLVHYGILPYWE